MRGLGYPSVRLIAPSIDGGVEEGIIARPHFGTPQASLAKVMGILILTWGCGGSFDPSRAQQKIVVGSKPFNEGTLLAEIFSQQLEDKGYQVQRKFGLGGTKVCFDEEMVTSIFILSTQEP